jgi:hypothetical protein
LVLLPEDGFGELPASRLAGVVPGSLTVTVKLNVPCAVGAP